MTTKEAIDVAREPFILWVNEADTAAVVRVTTALGQLAREVEAYHRLYGDGLTKEGAMEPQPALKLCRDCKHFSEYGDDDGGRCIRPVPRLEPDYVNGFLERELDYDAQRERNGSARGACGPSGKFWVKA